MSQEEKKTGDYSGGINFGNISSGQNTDVNLTNVAGGSQSSNNQVITINAAEGAIVATGGSTITVPADFGQQLADWKKQMAVEVNKVSNLDEDDKEDLMDALNKIEKEANKQADQVRQGSEADPQRLERLMNNVGAVSPDLLNVAIQTITTPLGGLGISAQQAGGLAQFVKQ